MSRKHNLLGVAAAVGGLLLGSTILSTGANAALSVTGVCPAAGTATDCNLLVIFNADGSIVTETGPQVNYDGVEDALIGVINNTNHPITSFNVSSPGTDLFGFDGDGIDTFTGASNPNDNTGYGGPAGFFSGISAGLDSGTVNFSPAIAANGGTTYFSLEESINVNAPPIITPAPEPASLALLGTALAGLGLMRRRRRNV